MSLETLTNVSFVEGQTEKIQSIILPINTNARFVQLTQTGEEVEYFYLREVEILGKIGIFQQEKKI